MVLAAVRSGLAVTGVTGDSCWLGWPGCFAVTQTIASQCVQCLDLENFLILTGFF